MKTPRGLGMVLVAALCCLAMTPTMAQARSSDSPEVVMTAACEAVSFEKVTVEMAKFRMRPVVVDAAQWFEPGHPQHDPAMLVHRSGNTVDPPDYRQVGDLYLAVKGGMPNVGGPDIYMLYTREGKLRISPGDWIVTAANGERYVVSDETFRQTYEQLPPGPPNPPSPPGHFPVA